MYDIIPNGIGIRGGIASIKWNYSNYKLGSFFHSPVKFYYFHLSVVSKCKKSPQESSFISAKISSVPKFF